MHKKFVEGHRISYLDPDGTEQNPTLRLIGTEETDNDWIAVNQVALVQGEYHRRFDVVLYCNGMPVSIMELKKVGSKIADVAAAHAQLQTYLREFPLAFRFCVLTFVSDGIDAKYGTPFTSLNRFSPWNVDDDGVPVPPGYMVDGDFVPPSETAIAGLYNPTRFLQLMRSYTAFDFGQRDCRAGSLALHNLPTPNLNISPSKLTRRLVISFYRSHSWRKYPSRITGPWATRKCWFRRPISSRRFTCVNSAKTGINNIR